MRELSSLHPHKHLTIPTEEHFILSIIHYTVHRFYFTKQKNISIDSIAGLIQPKYFVYHNQFYMFSSIELDVGRSLNSELDGIGLKITHCFCNKCFFYSIQLEDHTSC